MHIPPNWGTFGVLIVSFLVFWLIFSRLFFRPFLNLLSEREQRFRSLNDRTEQLLKEARAADAAREERLNAVRREALEHRDAERRRVEAEAAQLLETAKADARASLDAARGRIESELKAAEHDLEQMGRTLAGELAERVLGRRLNGDRTHN
ncbi:MAG TPA: ATP synthase F0 subunit B [Candidatus Binataceae bacterium]|nr:ATP synthase F0 subunit B [Candidatus Binataceae bacterium]